MPQRAAPARRRVLTCPSRTAKTMCTPNGRSKMVFACAPDFLLSPSAPLR